MNKMDLSPSQPTQEAGLRRYAALGLGTAVLVGAVTTTDAAVSYTNYNGQLLTDTNTTDTSGTLYSFDVNGDGTNDISFEVRNEGSASANNYALVFGGITGSTLTPVNVVGTSNQGSFLYVYPSRLTNGTVDAAKTFKTLSFTASGKYAQQGSLAFGNGFTGSKWKTGGANSGYLGFSFTLADGVHYGFVGLTVEPQGDGADSRAISIGGIGYETTPDTAITVFGNVPEPSSVAMVALGAGGLAAYRQRRKKAAAKASKETVG